jgi:hypothetical protein
VAEHVERAEFEPLLHYSGKRFFKAGERLEVS